MEMQPNLVLSIGTILSVLGLFYTLHKDSKKNAEEMANLKARVKSLEEKSKHTDVVLQELLSSVQEIKIVLAKIDTKLTIVEQELNNQKENNKST